MKLLPGSEAAQIVPEVAGEPTDLVLPRLHGLSPFQGTELDSILRNLGVRTIVGVGVSVNVAIQNLAFDAVNASYQVVIPRDAVAGFPAAVRRCRLRPHRSAPSPPSAPPPTSSPPGCFKKGSDLEL